LFETFSAATHLNLKLPELTLAYRGLNGCGADNIIVWNLPCCDIL